MKSKERFVVKFMRATSKFSNILGPADRAYDPAPKSGKDQVPDDKEHESDTTARTSTHPNNYRDPQ